MDNDTINTVFKKYINPLNFNVIQRMIDQSGMDKYAKKLFTPMMIKLFIYAQLKNLSSLGRISDHVKRRKKVQKQIGLKSISKSQLSRKLRDIPSDFFYTLLHQMIQELHQTLGNQKAVDKSQNAVFKSDLPSNDYILFNPTHEN